MMQYKYMDWGGYQEFSETIFESCLYHYQTIGFYVHRKRDIKQLACKQVKGYLN